MFVYYKYYILTELTFLKERILIMQMQILNIKGSEYGCIISLIRKNEVINLMRNADLTEKRETL